jgi:hypothetical protein
MPKRRDVVLEQLGELKVDLQALWVALTADPKKEARKERAWTILAGILGAAATIAARRTTAKAWATLTGEPPPTPQQAPAQRKDA